MENAPAVKAAVPPALAGLSPEQLAKLPQVVGIVSLGEGHETVEGILEITMPRARAIQYVSAEAKLPEGERIAPGKFINSLTKEELPKAFIPILKFTTFIQWNPRKTSDANFDKNYQPGELIFQTNEVKDQRVQAGIKFGPNGEAPKVTRYMNFLCYFEGNNLPVILSFAKTSMKAGEALNSLLVSKGGNVWNYKFQVSVVPKSGVEGEYFVLDIKPAGMATEEERVIGKLWFDMFNKKNIKVDQHEDENTAAPGSDVGGPTKGEGWE